MEQKAAAQDALTIKLQRIEDLAERLIYIKWSREFFVMLLRAVQDVLSLARPRPDSKKIVALTEQLEQQISQCLTKGELPWGAERDRLITVMDALCNAYPLDSASKAASNSGLGAQPPEGRTVPLFSKWGRGGLAELASDRFSNTAAPIWLVTPGHLPEFAHKLEQRGGFQVQHLKYLAEAHHLLAQRQQPSALIVDLDFSADTQTTLREATALRTTLAPEIPLFFLADRGDITARVEAVEAGGSGYFTKPVDIAMLQEALDARVFRTADQRILIVEDKLTEAREIARLLESRGMVAQVLVQPILILQMLYNFQPNLLIISLDIHEIDGLTLAQAIRQHEQFRELPLILLSAQTDLSRRLSTAGMSNQALLSKPLSPEALLAAVVSSLRQKRQLYRKISQLSNRDTVSGLYNRPYFVAYVERALAAMAVNAKPVAIMLITLDNLRTVKSRDVTAADDVVEQAAKRLRGALGKGPVAARFGDAVFAVLLGFVSQEALLATARTVQTSLETELYKLTDPYKMEGSDFQLRTGVGISIAHSNVEVATLIQQADLACGMARESKDTRIHVHHGKADQQENTQHQRLLEEIREMVQQQRMNLLFQPIVSLRGDTIERYEVFLRMHNNQGWELLPETVFTIVKRHRIGMVLDRWVIAHSIRLLRERQARRQSTTLFINISPTILQDEELLSWLRGGLQKTGVSAGGLVFEITETTAELQKQVLQPFLRQLKELGCGLSLDHFSGHERAQALAKLLQVDYVKLDTNLVQKLDKSQERQQQLQELTQALAALGITTIATGIENAATLPALWACGIDYAQGFFLQRPHTEMSYDFGHVLL
ncbi:MAG: EAL domain-containing protein [Candidatus Competibacteraceae bacterium]